MSHDLLDGYSDSTTPLAPPPPPANPPPKLEDLGGGAPGVEAAVPKASSKFIAVPQRIVNGGVDFKFEEDPMLVKLGGVMKADDYVQAICPINDALKECRATSVDYALLMMGPAMLPLIPWAYRDKQRKTKRKKIMQRSVMNFNRTNTLNLVMRWQTRPAKQLTIWLKDELQNEVNK